MRPGDAACATEAKSNWYVVTLPDGDTVISSQPLLHSAYGGSVVNALTTKPVESLDPALIVWLAKFIALNNENVTFVKFSSNKVIDAYLPWINIFQFLFGKTFQMHVPNSPAQQLARFSACIARPSLLLATDVVVRAALCGDEVLARRMIASNPNYLLQRGNATDFSGRKYDNLTPFQAALITGDIEMAEMMKPFFACLENGEAEMQNQVTEIFPKGIKEHETDQKGKSKTEFEPRLNELIEAIKKASNENLEAVLNNKCNNSILYLALKKFRDEFAELSQEKIFNPYYLLAAFEAYVNKFDWKNPDWNQLDLFWRQVIGFVQRFLPATHAQAFAYGLYDIVKNKHSCPRSFNFRYDSGFSFYPLTDSFTGLGFNFASCARRLRPAAPAAQAAERRLSFQNLCQTKTTSFQNLLRHEHNPPAAVRSREMILLKCKCRHFCGKWIPTRVDIRMRSFFVIPSV